VRTLAIQHVTNVGVPTCAVVINHTDCDSVLSSGTASGHLEPLKEYGVAAIAADHTGEENDIADLLQALDERRDLCLAFTSLDRIMEGSPFGGRRTLDYRRRRREQAARLALNNL
jgi:hypothetical protein